jgi:hypothetical protein
MKTQISSATNLFPALLIWTSPIRSNVLTEMLFLISSSEKTLSEPLKNTYSNRKAPDVVYLYYHYQAVHIKLFLVFFKRINSDPKVSVCYRNSLGAPENELFILKMIEYPDLL